MHWQYLINTQLWTLKGFDNLFKQTDFRYEDRRPPDCKYTASLRELRSRCVHVPDPKTPGTTVLKPVFTGVYTNTNSSTVIVIIVSGRAEAVFIYKKMSKCTFA